MWDRDIPYAGSVPGIRIRDTGAVSLRSKISRNIIVGTINMLWLRKKLNTRLSGRSEPQKIRNAITPKCTNMIVRNNQFALLLVIASYRFLCYCNFTRFQQITYRPLKLVLAHLHLSADHFG